MSKYWQKVKFDMIAKLENIGPFHLFFTLSCGDTRYDENFSTFLDQNGYEMEYIYRPDSTTETRVISKDGRRILASSRVLFNTYFRSDKFDTTFSALV